MVQLPKYRELPKDIRKNSIIRGVGYAVVLVVFFVVTEFSIYSLIEERLYRSHDQAYRFQNTQMADRFEARLNQLKMEFQILANSEIARRCLKEQSNRSCTDVTSLMKTMLETNRDMDHIRLINQNGREVVRVNRFSDGNPHVVGKEKLQSKRKKRYFNHAMETTGAEVYISKLELNMEHGKVETPLKPIIRFGKSIRTKKNNPLGIAIANYRVTSLLKNIDAGVAGSDGRFYLLNNEGYYLHGPSSKLEFSFMFPERSPVGFFSEYPEEWRDFRKNGQTAVDSDAGNFFFREVNIDHIENAVSSEDSWVLVIHVPSEARFSSSRLLILGLVAGAIFFMPLIALLGWKNGRYKVFQQWYINELTNKSLTDDLTGVLNHRGVMKKLKPIIQDANDSNRPFVLIFVDINDLKLFNDKMGHEMGDRLIQSAARAMLQVVRKSDVVGRLGGDEFVLGLVDCKTPVAISVMERVEKMLEDSGLHTTGSPWTMSWGYTEREADDTPEQMIARADQRMYSQKNAYKTGRHKLMPLAPDVIDEPPPPPDSIQN